MQRTQMCLITSCNRSSGSGWPSESLSPPAANPERLLGPSRAGVVNTGVRQHLSGHRKARLSQPWEGWEGWYGCYTT